jgi:hypothetical protein
MNKIALAAIALICTSASAHAQSFYSEDLSRRTIERRVVEAVIWGMPAVNVDLMLQAMIGSAKGKPNQIVYWSRLPDWKNQTLTPNPDVIYLMLLGVKQTSVIAAHMSANDPKRTLGHLLTRLV